VPSLAETRRKFGRSSCTKFQLPVHP
jgi:hypothetical protein